MAQATAAISIPATTHKVGAQIGALSNVSLRVHHNTLIATLEKITPPAELTVFDSQDEQAFTLHRQAEYLRKLAEVFREVFEVTADNAADCGGARIESFDIIEGAVTDFVSPLVERAEDLEGMS